jgi:hypothetical protein
VACNTDFYTNASGEIVHSPSCGRETEKKTAICRDQSVSFSLAPGNMLRPRRRRPVALTNLSMKDLRL